ncbi:MAG: ABC transporter permease [Nitrospinota bacterium]|jgi:peptide/nickel transport system permease protein|nr:ABC transporter permease [Nitrospinota bacterium]MDP7505410.1 ABC transporter permease [Nitrospinota bacterium]MDP7662086.1 ABC transporter permease [Nitrospinota bacterium]
MATERIETISVPPETWEEDTPAPSDLQLAVRDLMRRPPALFGFLCITFVIVWALVPGWFSPMDPYTQDLDMTLKPPGFTTPAGFTYWVGSDELGRDMLSRIIWGARVSLIVGFVAVLLSGMIGMTLGLVSGYYGGLVDTIISRIVDIALSVPFILLAMSIIAILGPSLQNVILAMAVRTWIVYARPIRGAILSAKEFEYVVGAKASGCRTPRILVRHLLPNVLSTAIVIATLYLGRMIIIEASLSFLGVGVPPPTPSWGGMLADGRSFLDTAWWLALFPGLALMFTVLGVNLLGDWIRDALDPRMKRLAD